MGVITRDGEGVVSVDGPRDLLLVQEKGAG